MERLYLSPALLCCSASPGVANPDVGRALTRFVPLSAAVLKASTKTNDASLATVNKKRLLVRRIYCAPPPRISLSSRGLVSREVVG